MDDDEIIDRFQRGLKQFFYEEMELLGFDVNERAITAVLAHLYLSPLFPDHRVDAEYNRVGIERAAKELNLPEVCGGGGLRRVFPDIIIHVRGHNRENLLVVELKKSTNPEPRDCDRAKVEAFRKQLGYRLGVFIDLPTGDDAATNEPNIEWFGRA